MDQVEYSFADSPITRDRDQFLRELLRELAGILEDTVGLEEAAGFIALVGGRIGEMMDQEYRRAAGTARLEARQVAAALVDLKARIEGGFSVESMAPDRIVLVNTRCPFGRYVEGRESLCMMTSNVFGRLAANNLGYARVELAQTQARGDPGCRVIVHLQEGDEGLEYFG
ncbi:transcriptional regulator [Aquicoccus sp. SCR17]|nr:transcriptional regulator [Carideicomes alvinocaridis]